VFVHLFVADICLNGITERIKYMILTMTMTPPTGVGWGRRGNR